MLSRNRGESWLLIAIDIEGAGRVWMDGMAVGIGKEGPCCRCAVMYFIRRGYYINW